MSHDITYPYRRVVHKGATFSSHSPLYEDVQDAAAARSVLSVTAPRSSQALSAASAAVRELGCRTHLVDALSPEDVRHLQMSFPSVIRNSDYPIVVIVANLDRADQGVKSALRRFFEMNDVRAIVVVNSLA